MAVTTKNIIPRKSAETSQTAQYTANNCRTLVTKFTATNTGSSNQTISINLIAASGSASAANRVLSVRQIAPGETYLCPEVVGQVIEDGGFISTLASSTDLTISATGQEITS
jgi:hypothetical protein